MDKSYKGPCTIYVHPQDLRGNAWGYQRIEVREFQFETAIQDDQEIELWFIGRGRRKKLPMYVDANSSLVILKGWDHEDVANQVEYNYSNDGSYVVEKPKFEVFSSEWTLNFNDFIENYIIDKKPQVLFDIRRIPSISEVNNSNVLPEINQDALKILPNILPESNRFIEGEIKEVILNKYERNKQARKQCIEHYGSSCFICGMNFGRLYGSVAEGFIHVHHLVPLSAIRESYEVDPLQDLRPVCPNCHAMMHLENPPPTPDEVREWLSRNRE